MPGTSAASPVGTKYRQNQQNLKIMSNLLKKISFVVKLFEAQELSYTFPCNYLIVT